VPYSYVEVQRYVDHLNEAFEAAWSREVVRREIIDDQIIVEGRLTTIGVIKTDLRGEGKAQLRRQSHPGTLARCAR
jgi:hypothetical protein